MTENKTFIKGYNLHGVLVLETWHTTPGSITAELGAYADRMRRGEIGRVEIIKPGKPVETITPWSNRS